MQYRGYSVADDVSGFRSVNPLFMKYTPTNKQFSGQLGYGYRSFEAFIDASSNINNGGMKVVDYDHILASIANTYQTTAILEAGRRSLDLRKSIQILYDDASNLFRPTSIHTV